MTNKIVNPVEVLSHLLEADPRRLEQLPDIAGLYALRDHLGVVRYIGMTEMGIRRRVLRYHVAGDGNSHKFSTAYNAGRLYHERRDPASQVADGRISKTLRRILAREHCTATAFALPGATKDVLLALEARIIALAPAEALTWNHSRSLPASEPVELVDKLLDHLGWDESQRAAITRQAVRWQTRQDHPIQS